MPTQDKYATDVDLQSAKRLGALLLPLELGE